MKRLPVTIAGISLLFGTFAAPTPLPPELDKLTLVKDSKPVVREIRPGVTYHACDFMHFPVERRVSESLMLLD